MITIVMESSRIKQEASDLLRWSCLMPSVPSNLQVLDGDGNGETMQVLSSLLDSDAPVEGQKSTPQGRPESSSEISGKFFGI